MVGSINGDMRLYGLTEPSMKLEDIGRRQRLITSYKKSHTWRAANP